jgi:hypothetical protein
LTEKITETATSIIYDFGYGSRELTGRFEYNKAEEKAKIVKSEPVPPEVEPGIAPESSK